MNEGLSCFPFKPRILCLSWGNEEVIKRRKSLEEISPLAIKNLVAYNLIFFSYLTLSCVRAFLLCQISKFKNEQLNDKRKELKAKHDACSRLYGLPISTEAREIYLSCLAETHKTEITVKPRKLKTAEALFCFFFGWKFLSLSSQVLTLRQFDKL